MHLKRCILVTGRVGLPGSHLCECLPVEGCQVLCLNNLFIIKAGRLLLQTR